MKSQAKKVLVLQGGSSNEREVSLRSADNVATALVEAGHEVITADPSDKGFDLKQLASKVDLVFPILHGAGGEDGAIQDELERVGVPFLGSDAEAARLTFNKFRYEEKLAEHGMLTPNWEVVNRESFQASDLIRNSYVLKPISGGSSIDTFIVHNPQHQAIKPTDFDEVFGRYGDMLLEELIEGQEITVAVLGNEALPIILIIPPTGGEFDYENKYNGKSQEIPQPDSIASNVQKTTQELAAKIQDLTGCRHLTRTDMIIAENGAIYILETNTVPGLTKQSLFPKAAAASGIETAELVDRFVMMYWDCTRFLMPSSDNALQESIRRL